ncbi:MAG TPA: amidohydrolase family protein [Terriglobales bacterium]|nr:amidohydrolase family protein [Terriglobales bacterium]
MRVFFLAFLCLNPYIWAQSNAEPSAQTLIFTNVNVVDTRGGGILPDMTVVVRSGRIQAVARFSLIAGSHNVRVINAAGKYMMPGLWDMDVHSASTSAAWDEKIIYPLYVANGVTGVRDMGADPDLLEQQQQRVEGGALPGPHILLAGPLLSSGKSATQDVAVNNPTEARDAVAQLQKRGVNLLTIRSDISRESYFALAAEAAKLKIQFAGPIPDSVTAAEASAAGQRSIERLSGILLACSSEEEALRQRASQALANQDVALHASVDTLAMATYDPEKAWNLFVELSNNNTWQVPALVWSQTMVSMGDTSFAAEPRLKYVPISVRHQWELKELRPRTSPDALELAKKHSARELELVNAMRRAGVQFMAGSNGPDTYVFPGFSLHTELEWLVKSGFTPTQALQAATFNPALFLAELDKFGVVESGHAADLVLLEANPLEDIRNTRKIAAVMMGGKYYSRQELDRILAQIAEIARRK